MAWLANRHLPDMSFWRSMRQGALMTMIVLGSEWCHNLAHAFAARAIGKPMDQIRIMLGMPRCVYHDLNDPDVKPNEHVIRALGGPLINALFLPLAWLVRQLTTEGTPARQAANLAVGTNLFLSTVSLLPIPGIDGGPILKWSLVERGRSVEEAEEAVRSVNGPLALAAALLAGLAFRTEKNPYRGHPGDVFALVTGHLPWLDSGRKNPLVGEHSASHHVGMQISIGELFI